MKISKELSVYTLFEQFRSGFQRLQRLRCVSFSGLQVSVIGLLSVACGLILTVRGVGMGSSHSLPWNSEGSASSKKKFVPGLRNLGNNCFLNVILQALASCTSFRLFLEENVVDSISKLSSNDHVYDGLPLSDAVIALFEAGGIPYAVYMCLTIELCTPQDKRKTLNPRGVMSAMDLYIPHFELANQQDAAEAFLHLLSCLRKEFSESHLPDHASLADMGNMVTSTGRIVTLDRSEDASVSKKWKKRFIGPFGGILSSFLTCQSCSAQILLDFEFFHTLSLSPEADAFASIVDKCTIDDCLRKFMAAERVENYHCSHCWHLAAIKYLSSTGGHKEEMRMLSCCSEQDCCDCRNLSCLQGLQWSNRSSHTVKQLSINCCPKILCLHIQRASVNIFGEPIKVQGHVSFPMVLDLSPFVDVGVGIRSGREISQKPSMQHYDPSSIFRYNMQTNRRILDLMSGLTREKKLLEEVDDQRSDACSNDIRNHTESYDKLQKVGISHPFGSPVRGLIGHNLSISHDGNMSGESACNFQASNHVKASGDSHTYRLVSVVEHFGRSGSGHYTVYRGANTNIEFEEDGSRASDSPLQWFCVSDSVVHPASEEEVLAAHATLLFYERIVDT